MIMKSLVMLALGFQTYMHVQRLALLQRQFQRAKMQAVDEITNQAMIADVAVNHRKMMILRLF